MSLEYSDLRHILDPDFETHILTDCRICVGIAEFGPDSRFECSKRCRGVVRRCFGVICAAVKTIYGGRKYEKDKTPFHPPCSIVFWGCCAHRLLLQHL